MKNNLLAALDGKSPKVCFDNLYAAIYVVAKQMIDEDYPASVMIDKLNKMQEQMVKGIKGEDKYIT